MRVTITLDEDVAAAIEELRLSDGIGRSEAVNCLIRDGLAAGLRTPSYEHQSTPMGARMDVSNIGSVLDLLNGD